MKICVIILAFLINISLSLGQTTKKELLNTQNKTGGVYYAYPSGDIVVQTPVLKDYKPFYISHFGRHGSRYLISDNEYKKILDIFENAKNNNALMPLGIDVYSRLCKVWAEADGHGGDLSPLGVRQQRDIAERMYKSFPEVFSDNVPIFARSTTVVRCVLSMDAFSERLKEFNPTLQITREASNKYMRYLDHYTKEAKAYKDSEIWREEYRKFEENHVNPTRLISALFSDDEFVLKRVNPKEVMWSLFSIAGNMQNMETDLTFYDLFDEQELFDLWQCGNYYNYVCNANYAQNGGVMLANAKPVLKNILESARSVISSNSKEVTLRFAHDGNLIPLTLLLHLDGSYESVSEPSEFYKVWCNFRISPMAANIQIIFFRKKGSDDIIVKFLHNEKETLIPPVKSDILPYYHWADIETFYMSLLNEE